MDITLNSNSISEDIKQYWESSTPMQFKDEEWSYEKKRNFRYELQDYQHRVFGFEEWGGKKVLDFGCGSGIDSMEFARNGAIVTAVDITENACKLTTQNLHEYKDGIVNLVVHQINSLLLPFSDNYFDLVYSYGVLHHIPNIFVALKEIHRVTQPGGYFMGMIYNRHSLLYAYSILQKAIDDYGYLLPDIRIASEYSERIKNCPYTKCYKPHEVKELFERYFNNVEIGIEYNVIDLPGKRKVKFLLDTDDKSLGWHLIVKAVK